MQVQETPSVLLPGSYWDALRAPLKVGDSAPDWTLPRAAYDSKSPEKIEFQKWRDGKNFNGSVVIFWAFWCDTWKDMTRDLNLLRPQLGAMKLQVLAVSVDASQQPVSRARLKAGASGGRSPLTVQVLAPRVGACAACQRCSCWTKTASFAPFTKAFPANKLFIKTNRCGAEFESAGSAQRTKKRK